MSKGPTTRQDVVAFAATDEHASLYWTEVKPDMSQAALTFWVPMLPDFPYVLVDPVPGDHFMPSDRCRACRTGESVGDSAVDAWLGTHRQPVADLMSERVGQYRFYLRHQHLFPVIDMHGEILTHCVTSTRPVFDLTQSRHFRAVHAECWQI